MHDMLRKLEIEVDTELGLNDSQKLRVVAMVRRNRYVDHTGRYRDRHGHVHHLARIHFTCDPAKHQSVSGSSTAIDGLDSIRFPGTVHVVLEGTDGTRTGLYAARCGIAASWARGVVFAVDDEVWFAGREHPDSDPISADEPILKKLSNIASETPGSEPFPLADRLPAQGEFWITLEDEPALVAVAEWRNFGGEADPDDSLSDQERRAAESGILEDLVERVRALDPALEP